MATWQKIKPILVDMPIYTGDIIDYHSPYNSHLKLKAFCFLGEKPFA